MAAIVTGFRPTPDARAALDRAVEECRLRDATLVVVHSMRGGERDDLRRVLEEREEFERLDAALTAAGIPFELVGLARGNSPAEDLILEARERDADLVVIGMRRRSPLAEALFGSTAREVLTGAGRPVLAVSAEG
jgi:nucleotide-binding universal stress UspA family protein